jgi:hypothetical protein
MTRAHLLKGSKEQIAESLKKLPGEVTEAIVFEQEPSAQDPEAATGDIFAEMEPFTVRVGDADDSREAIYSRANGE